MLNFMYLWFPMISIILISIIMYNLKVEKANADWDAEHGVTGYSEAAEITALISPVTGLVHRPASAELMSISGMIPR